MSHRHEVTVELVRSGISVPLLLWVAPVAAVLLGAGLFGCSTFGPFVALIFAVVEPLWAVLTALGLRPGHSARYPLIISAVVCFGLGVLPAILGFVDLSPNGFRAMGVERSVDRLEDNLSPSGDLESFKNTPPELFVKMSPDQKRRAAILLARAGDWRASHDLWQMAAVSHKEYFDEEIASAMTKIISEGISQYQLIRICTTLEYSNMPRQAVALWRAYYPSVRPESWHALLDRTPQ